MRNPAYQDASVAIYHGDVREVLREMPDESVNCVVTSPPYWGLRDYGCEGQIGLEKTPEEYIAVMVEVFREARRVLRKDGTLWLNMGDSYAGSGRGMNGDGSAGKCGEKQQTNTGSNLDFHDRLCEAGAIGRKWVAAPMGYKQKDLVGIPWMLAFALRADGWYLRQDIIWSKPNPMPESVTDRCTKAHEYIFLLSKSERYYYNLEATKEPTSGTAHARGDGVNPKVKQWKTPDGWDTSKGNGGHGSFHREGREDGFVGYKRTGRNSRQCVDQDPTHLAAKRPKQNESFSGAVNELVDERNRRSVWTVATQPFPEAHFATFPEELIKPCILAGCPEGGTVLDPFMGSGTTGLVAKSLHCKAIGVELNELYIQIAARRLRQEVLSFA